MANSADPEKTSYLDLHCLQRYLYWYAKMKGLSRWFNKKGSLFSVYDYKKWLKCSWFPYTLIRMCALLRYIWTLQILTPKPSPAEPVYAHCLCKHCRSRLVCFFRSLLIWIYTVCLQKPTDLDLHCLSLSMGVYINNLDQVIWLAEN